MSRIFVERGLEIRLGISAAKVREINANPSMPPHRQQKKAARWQLQTKHNSNSKIMKKTFLTLTLLTALGAAWVARSADEPAPAATPAPAAAASATPKRADPNVEQRLAD